jgi:hypothetical protein
MDNPEKLATLGTQEEAKQNKDSTQYVLNTTSKGYNTLQVNNIISNV